MNNIKPLDYISSLWKRAHLPEGSFVIANKTVVHMGQYVPAGAKGSLVRHRKSGFCDVTFVTPLAATVRMKVDELSPDRVWDVARSSPGVVAH